MSGMTPKEKEAHIRESEKNVHKLTKAQKTKKNLVARIERACELRGLPKPNRDRMFAMRINRLSGINGFLRRSGEYVDPSRGFHTFKFKKKRSKLFG